MVNSFDCFKFQKIMVRFFITLMLLFLPQFAVANQLLLDCSISGVKFTDWDGKVHVIPDLKIRIKHMSAGSNDPDFNVPEGYRYLDYVSVSTTSRDGKKLEKPKIGIESIVNAFYWVNMRVDRILLTNQYAIKFIGTGDANYLVTALRYISIDRINGKLKILDDFNKQNGSGSCSAPKKLF